MCIQQETREQIEARGHRVTRDLFEQAARLAWYIGTSGDRTIETYDSDAYRTAWKLAETLYFASYADATAETWQFVSDRISELGPDDSYNRVEGSGVDSYHRGARLEAAERRVEEAVVSFADQLGALLHEAFTERNEAARDLPADSLDRDFRKRLYDAMREQIGRYGY